MKFCALEGCPDLFTCVLSSLVPRLVSRARLSRGRESGQFPIIISFLTCQEFLGVLIGLGRRAVVFFGRAYGKAGNGSGMETENGNWKWKYKSGWSLSCPNRLACCRWLVASGALPASSLPSLVWCGNE